MICSVMALALVIERLYSLRASRVHPPGLVDEVIAGVRQGVPTDEALDRLESDSALGAVLAAGLRSVSLQPRPNEAALRQALESAGRQCIHQLQRYLNALGTIASAAPLLGLLGTVIGMIEIFASQAPGTGGGNPQQLAHGISVALYNTAFGLMVAIPALMFHRHFRSRVETFRLRLEREAERVLPHLLRLAQVTRSAPAA
jgi:biopolymer transport protein ExbB